MITYKDLLTVFDAAWALRVSMEGYFHGAPPDDLEVLADVLDALDALDGEAA